MRRAQFMMDLLRPANSEVEIRHVLRKPELTAEDYDLIIERATWVKENAEAIRLNRYGR